MKIASQQYDAESIQKLEGLEAVYKRPGMYVGEVNQNGMHHCLIEIIDNSVDEHNGGFCNQIIVELFEDDSVSVTDNGRGIPVSIHPEYGVATATIAVTELHAGGKFGGKNSSYNKTGGLHGVGASVVNALSEWFEMTIYRNGKVYFQRFECQFSEDGEPTPGKAVNPLMEIGDCPADKFGTQIKFKLNPHVFSTSIFNEETETYQNEYYEFDPNRIKAKLELLSFLNPGLELIFIDNKTKKPVEYQSNYCKSEILENNVEKTTWKAEKLSNYLDVLSDDMGEVVSPVLEHNMEVLPPKGSKRKDGKDMGTIQVNVAMQWFTGNKSKVKGYVNNIYTPQDGTHIEGLRRALSATIKGYVNNLGTGIAEKDKKSFDDVTIDDITEGLAAVLSIKIEEPGFASQTKEKLVNKEATYAVKKAVSEYLNRILEENPKLAKDIVQRVLDSKRYREAAAKLKLVSTAEKNSWGYSQPEKLAACQSNNPEICELYLVEGDSAGGSAKMARDKRYQAILPLKGKILNVHGLDTAKILANSEVNTIISALNCGVGQHQDLSKLRYHKIIYMTDADVDGQHIRTLLSCFFYKLFPDLLKNGHIYMAQPPLYSVKKKRGNADIVYIQNDEELRKFETTQGSNMDLWTVSRFKGLGEMNPDQLAETTMNVNTRILAKLEYDENYAELIANTFDVLMGDDPDKRKAFLAESEL